MNKENKIVVIVSSLLVITGIAVYLSNKKKKPTGAMVSVTPPTTDTTDSGVTTIDELFGNTPITASSSSFKQILANQPTGHDGGYGDPSVPYVALNTDFTLADLPTYTSPNGKKLKFFIYSIFYPSYVSKPGLYASLKTGTVTYSNFIGVVDTATNILYPVNFSTAVANGFTDSISDIPVADVDFKNSFIQYKGTGTDYGYLNNNQLIQ